MSSQHENQIRSFKAVSTKRMGNDKYQISEHGLLKNNRYTIKHQQSPEDAAKKVFKRICRLQTKNNACKASFALMETTRGSGKRLFFYAGERVYIPKDKQKKPVTFKDGRVVTFEYDHKVHAVSNKKLGHSNPLSGWKSKGLVMSK